MTKNSKNIINEWKPKKYAKNFKIDLKTGKITPLEIFEFATQEEENKIETEIANKWLECMKILWGDKFEWFMENLKYYVNKHGEKEFCRIWRKEMNKK